jgi:DNA-binding transcriptional LysR family regulator
MRTTDLSELAAFDAVARHRSFRRASEERGVTASAISHAVSNLESRVGIRLLNRTTRSVSLTDAGAMLLAQLSPAFSDIGSALDALNQFRDTPFGKVRINAPNSIAPFVLGPMIGPLIGANPNLELEIVATDRLVDIVEEGFDAGIRLGESLRDGMTAVKIKPRLKFAVVGSPDYFARRSVPRTPAELSEHMCIRNMYPSGVGYPWAFSRNGEEVEVDVKGPVALHDHELMIETALAGVALAYVWEDRARPYVASGRLDSCLDDWIVPEDWLYLYYPTRRYISASLRAVIDALKASSV